MPSIRYALALFPWIWFCGGCSQGRVSTDPGGPTPEELIAYYSPRSIKILPFTKAKSFDNDAIPDGIEVSLRTLDGAGDSIKAYGTFLFELYAYEMATADHRGPRIQSWNPSVLTLDDQKAYWERVTTTYQFQLSWEGVPIPPQRKYILTASFQAPGGERLFDEYEFEFRVDRREILEGLSESKQGE
jgi:hypothetical protein